MKIIFNKNTSSRDLKKSKNGYSLIELMIAVMIMVIIFSLGTASYRSYQRKQYFDAVVRDFVASLRLAQELALSGRKPSSDCTSLVGYTVEARRSQKDFRVSALCSGPSQYCSASKPDLCYSERKAFSNDNSVIELSWGGGNVLYITFTTLGKGAYPGNSAPPPPQPYPVIPQITISYKLNETVIYQKNIVVNRVGNINVQ